MEPDVRELTYAVVDVETTGIAPGHDAVVEVACVVVRAGREVRSFSSLVDPGRPIPPRAAAVHHLTDEHVRGEPSLAEIAPIVEQLCANAVVVAHNAEFDLGFLRMLAARPSLCTLRLARHCFPELTSHANQVLRYALEVAPSAEGPAHRALADARVTASLLNVLLRRYCERGEQNDLRSLLEFAQRPIMLGSLPFGRYKDVPLGQIPEGYLHWMLRQHQAFDRDVRHSVLAEIGRRGELRQAAAS